MTRLTLLLSALLVASLALVTAGQAPTAAPFTADQAAAGRAAYETTCAGCHGANLAGPPAARRHLLPGAAGAAARRVIC